MKKNKTMRVASVLLMAVLLTTSIISGTFAKYTTEDGAQDQARVAKWGVALQAAGILYGESYNGTNHTPLAWTSANAETVSASADGTNVVAPGTKSDEGLKFSLNGVPEVSGDVTTTISYENIYLKTGKYGVMVKYGTTTQTAYDAMMAATEPTDKLYVKSGSNYTLATAFATGTEYYTLEDYVDLTEDYYPVEYSMTGATTKYNDGYTVATTTDTLAQAVAQLTANLGTAGTATVADGKTTTTYTKHFVPGTDLASDMKIEGQAIAWKWDFENGTAGDGNAASMYSKADTILGNLQAGTTTAIKGTVVKLSGTNWVAPEAATGTDAKDFNLETSFSINIVVTQAD